ncbi:MAG: CsgG/HfaB family protein, partial [Victivallales bacterium]|nr:CsgG/HfaB family protein [Victivallales bacterium]
MKRIFWLICILAGGVVGAAAPVKQPTLAVMPFLIGNNIRVVNAGNFRLTAEIAENEFTNNVQQFFVRSRKFNVLDRTSINRIMDENKKLTASEWAKPGQEQEVGRLLVADYLVTGNINRLEFVVTPQDIAITGEHAPRLRATLKCQYKVTEVSSGKIVAAGQVKQVLRSEDVRRRVPAQERRDWTLADYKDILFDGASTVVGTEILAGIYPIKIATIDGAAVTLNRGEGAGLAPGSRLNVFNAGADT